MVCFNSWVRKTHLNYTFKHPYNGPYHILIVKTQPVVMAIILSIIKLLNYKPVFFVCFYSLFVVIWLIRCNINISYLNFTPISFIQK